MGEGRSFQAPRCNLVLALAMYSRVITTPHRYFWTEDAMGLRNVVRLGWLWSSCTFSEYLW